MTDRLLTDEELLDYHQLKFPHMYRGNDRTWCEEQREAILKAYGGAHSHLIREAQDAKTLRIVGEWLMSHQGADEDWPDAVRRLRVALIQGEMPGGEA